MPIPFAVGAAGKAWLSTEAAKGARDTLNNAFGRLEDSVVVHVVGQPGSNRETLFKLAAATAFGIAKPLIRLGFGSFTPPGSVGIEWNASTRELVFVLKYSRSIKSIILGANRTALMNQPVFKGPPETVVGASYEFRPPVPGGIAPGRLPFDGKVILTTADEAPDSNPASVGDGPTGPTKNPRPAGDARSRGSLNWLVFQSLATPADFSTQSFDLPTDANRFTGG